jgi:hypothetical protein
MTRWLPVLVTIGLGLGATARGEEAVTARAAVGETRVYVGEPFVLQVIVEGEIPKQQPDLPALADFEVAFEGGRDASSESIVYVNGELKRQESRKKYIFQYRLRPRRAGSRTIPAIPVTVGGRTVRTQPLTVDVQEPRETEDFKLRLALEKPRAYAGEPVRFTLTWYLAKDVKGYTFSMPPLGDGLEVVDPPAADVTTDDLRSGRYQQIEFLGKKVLARKGQGELDGRRYTTLTIEKILIPRRAGSFAIGPATVALNAVIGRKRGRGLFDDPFFSDPFFDGPFSSRDVTKKLAVPSNAATLEGIALPPGAPDGFTGLVGRYRIETSAQPTDVSVGDPITLTIRIEGPHPLDRIPAPDLRSLPAFAERFKVPADMAPPATAGGSRTFVQTIRARRDDVREIPPVELSYFDAEAGAYRTARSKAIPLTVRPTREVTAADIEGLAAAPAAGELESLHRGIAHNYEDVDALRDQRIGLGTLVARPVWTVALFGPMLVYVALALLLTAKRRAEGDVAGRRRRRALARARAMLRGGDPGGAGDVASLALRTYVADMLDRPSEGMTSDDAVRLLSERGLPQAGAVRDLLGRCDAARYAGLESGDGGKLKGEADTLLQELEHALRKRP